MDEPCSALDAEGIERIEELIDGLRAQYTIVIVTHNMGQARRASHECIFMLLGRIIEHGSTLEMFLTPKQPDTEMYVSGHYGEPTPDLFFRNVNTAAFRSFNDSWL